MLVNGTCTPLTTVTVPVTDALAVESRIVREARRNFSPLRVQHLWDAIGTVQAHKHKPAIDRMARYMRTHHGLRQKRTQELLDLGVYDNVIKLETTIGTKGNKKGIEELAYRKPTPNMLPKERYDWYCFHCHNGGEVVLCIGCHRVYHESCLKEPLSEVNGFNCNFCKITQKVPEVNERERKDLNHKLLLSVKKLREKMPGNLMARELPERPPKKQKKYEEGEGDKKPEPEDDSWRAKFLLKEPMDFDMMGHKCQSNKYRIVEEFIEDALLIVHNTAIYHGSNSNMADVARQMFRDCTDDLFRDCTDDLKRRDSYRFATERPTKSTPVMTETSETGTTTGLDDNMVSSSSQEPRTSTIAVQTPSKLLKDLIAGSPKISKELRQLKEKIRAEVEADKDQEKKRAVNDATSGLKRDLERLKADHATEIEQLNEKQKQELIDLKKKPWCYNCKKEAILWCCVFETIDENTGVNSLLDN